MKVQQIYELMNNVTKEILGTSDIVTEDLSNVVDIGTQIFNATDVDNYVKKLVDHIGRVIFVDRPYRGTAPSVLMDSWLYGSVMEKIQCDLMDATENESWNLTSGNVYEQDKFTPPTISVKFFNSKVTFEVPISYTEMQVRESFSSVGQLNSFLSMIFNTVENTMSVKIEALIMRTINNMIAQTFYDLDQDGTYTGKSGNKCVNLLHLYNTKFTKELTAETALTDPDFIRFASMTMSLYIDRLAKMSTLFNIGKKARFTPRDDLHVIMLSEFVKSADVYLQSDTFHNTLTALPNADTVPYWQGVGTDYGFASTSEIHVNIADPSDDQRPVVTAKEVTATGILGVMFDRNALGVANYNRRVTNHYNAKAEFFNNWYKMDGHYFNDLNENFVVFYVA